MIWENALGCTYRLTADQVEGGRNRLGMDVSHIPLDVTLCGFCDTPISEGRCFNCRTIHTDVNARFAA